jgi:hypothetical protein
VPQTTLTASTRQTSKRLRLVERDRQLLGRHRAEEGLGGGPTPFCDGCHYEYITECPELVGAAAFWLGTQKEGEDHG